MSFLKVGHRGARFYEPENTLRSFKKAVKLGVDIIEFDVRQTKDGVPIVLHDKTVDRTTNGKGNVHRFTLKHIRKLDAGKGEQIPTLDEAINFAKKNKIKVFIELKEAEFCEKAVKIIEKQKMINESVIISFNANTLKQVAQFKNNIATGLIFSKPIKNEQAFFRLGKSCKAIWLMGELKVLNKRFVENAHKGGFKVEAWVANDKVTAKKLVVLGVDAIASDKPDVLKGL